MTTDKKPPFKVVENRGSKYADVCDIDDKRIIIVAPVRDVELICAALNHYYDHSPEPVTEKCEHCEGKGYHL